MKTPIVFVVAARLSTPLGAQEERKPAPKDSVRASVPGCSKGRIFTAGPRAEDGPSAVGVPAGMHLRMNGPKEMMAEIKRQERSRIEITGLIKKGQVGQDGVRLGPGVRITGGSAPPNGNLL